ncbi:MAG: NifB/NifX family molybdenum-iron cluster-binding protein [candidate division Zixibacteria bacterium]|nr:NifB/NifX family molybdenum-iron cluster-binding protein [candidate division Zixibacteria bacterium]
MKILLATEGNTLESKIAKRFGEAPYYLIFNSDSKETEARVNHGHDDNHSGLIDLVNEGILYFIIGNTGPNAFNVLDDKNAKLYLARGLAAKDALDDFLNDKLERLTKSTLKKPIRNK